MTEVDLKVGVEIQTWSKWNHGVCSLSWNRTPLRGELLKWAQYDNLPRPWRMTMLSLKATYISFGTRLWLADHRRGRGRLINYCLHLIIHLPPPGVPTPARTEMRLVPLRAPSPGEDILFEDWEEHTDCLSYCCNLAFYWEQMELAWHTQDLTSQVYKESKVDGNPEVYQFL